MRNILVDTDVLINFLRRKEKALDFLASSMQEGSLLLCSVITVAEIRAGMLAHETDQTRALLEGLQIMEVTREIAEKAGAYQRDIKSQRFELMDCLIVATAQANHATLATCNARHCPMKDIDKVTVEV